MLVVVVLFATVLVRAGIVLFVVYLILPATHTCPRCASELTMIRHPLLQVLLPVVKHKWCLDCGWSGIVREPQSRVINRAARS